jgi:hypothetical protein
VSCFVQRQFAQPPFCASGCSNRSRHGRGGSPGSSWPNTGSRRSLVPHVGKLLRGHPVARCGCCPRCIPPSPDIISCGKSGGSPAVVCVLRRSSAATRATDRDWSPPAACGHHRGGAAAQVHV